MDLREIVETGEIDIDELDDVLAAQLDSIEGPVNWTHQDRIEGRRRKRGCVPDRADTLRLVTSRRATGGPKVDIDSHQGESITGDLIQKAW